MLSDETEEFGPAFRALSESTEHTAGNKRGILFFDAAHHHAQVLGLDHDRHAHGLERIFESGGDLGGQALLDLQSPGEQVHDSRDLADTDDFAVGDIADVGFSEKWHEMMFAKTENLNIFDDDHFIVFFLKNGPVQYVVQGFPVPFGEKLIDFRHPIGGAEQALAGRVFPDQLEQ